MSEFREWLRQGELNESPKQIGDLGYAKVANDIKKLMAKYEYDPQYLEKIGDNLFEYSAADGYQLSNIRFVFYIENNIILGATVLKRITINTGKNIAEAYEALYTSNFTNTNVKGLLYKLYSTFSKKYNTYIVSGMQQTVDSRKVWSRWLREKQNIKEIFGYHYKERKYIEFKQISNYWDISDKMQERRIVVKFK